MHILVPVLTLGALGLLFGVGLAFASRKFAVHVDPRLEKIHGLLPGSNCGGCGGAGCFAFAEGLLSGKMQLGACRVAEDKVKEIIASLLGTAVEKEVKKVAVVHCHGGARVKERFVYDGPADCVAAAMLLGGQKSCVFGCLGLGTCARICPFDAIHMNSEGLPDVDEAKCTSCGKCVAGCPKGLFSLVPVTKRQVVRCRSLDAGKKVLDVCSVGCISCGKCVKACPVQAIKLVDNCAVIEYTVCDNRGECVRVCPTKAIVKL